jgi:hypothetical protein
MNTFPETVESAVRAAFDAQAATALNTVVGPLVSAVATATKLRVSRWLVNLLART